jgi:hypothetical protein
MPLNIVGELQQEEHLLKQLSDLNYEAHPVNAQDSVVLHGIKC